MNNKKFVKTDHIVIHFKERSFYFDSCEFISLFENDFTSRN